MIKESRRVGGCCLFMISTITCPFNTGASDPISNAHGNDKGQSRSSVVRVDLVELDLEYHLVLLNEKKKP